MDIYYQQKYLKYKYKYNMFGGSLKGTVNTKAQAQAQARILKKQQMEAEQKKIKEILKAWEQITSTPLFIAKVEMITSYGIKCEDGIIDIIEKAVEEVKTQIITDEDIKHEFYSITCIQEAMEKLGLKPLTESCTNNLLVPSEDDDYDFI